MFKMFAKVNSRSSKKYPEKSIFNREDEQATLTNQNDLTKGRHIENIEDDADDQIGKVSVKIAQLEEHVINTMNNISLNNITTGIKGIPSEELQNQAKSQKFSKEDLKMETNDQTRDTASSNEITIYNQDTLKKKTQNTNNKFDETKRLFDPLVNRQPIGES